MFVISTPDNQILRGLRVVSPIPKEQALLNGWLGYHTKSAPA